MLDLSENLRSLLLNLLYTLPAVVIGLTVHEASHAAAAVALGDDTPRREGRLTLNPSAHLDILGLLFFLLLGWGYARPVSVHTENLKGGRWGDAAVSAAGPLSNFLLSAVCFVLWSRLEEGIWTSFLLYGVSTNLTLCFLNFLPVPPLDGFQVMRAIFRVRGGKVLSFLMQYGFVLLLLLSFVGWLDSYLVYMDGLAVDLFAYLLG